MCELCDISKKGNKMFWNNFVDLCNASNETPNGVAKKLGFSTGTVTWWKKGRHPRDTALKKIADYFDVSVDYLLGNGDSKKKESDSYNSLRVNIPEHIDLQLFGETTPSPPLDPKLLSMIEGMSEEELADLKQYAEFILSKKKE